MSSCWGGEDSETWSLAGQGQFLTLVVVFLEAAWCCGVFPFLADHGHILVLEVVLSSDEEEESGEEEEEEPLLT